MAKQSNINYEQVIENLKDSTDNEIRMILKVVYERGYENGLADGKVGI